MAGILVELAPLAGTLATLAVRRGRMVEAGLVGLALSLPAAAFALRPEFSFAPFVADAALRGLWLALHAASVITAGLFFFEVTRAGWATDIAAPGAVDPRKLWFGCFLLGPFCEAATGVGVGLVILVPYLQRMGLGGGIAVAFGLFSQILVPWGTLAIGTVLGAELAHLPLESLGLASAWLTAPLLLVYLATYWLLRAACLGRPRAAECVDDLLWTAALWALLLLAHRVVATDTAGLAAAGSLLLLRFLRDGGARARRDPRLLREAAPYALLTAVLLLVRGIPGVSSLLAQFWTLRPFNDLAPFPIFQHASFWVALVAAIVALAEGLPAAAWRDLGARLAARAWRPVTVTVVFVVMGEILALAGISEALAGELSAALGWGALAVSPWLAAAAGFLAGTNFASNAMLMPMQVALAGSLGVDPRWLAALQNVAGSNFTLLSPIRVAMGAALAGEGAAARDAAGEAYRRLLPLGIALLAILALMGLLLRAMP
jgi:lactate permease